METNTRTQKKKPYMEIQIRNVLQIDNDQLIKKGKALVQTVRNLSTNSYIWDIQQCIDTQTIYNTRYTAFVFYV